MIRGGRTLFDQRPVALAIALALGVSSAALAQASVNVIPEPSAVRLAPSAPSVWIRDGAPIIVPAHDAQALQVARYLADLVQRTRGLRLVPQVGGAAPANTTAIVIRRADTAAANREAYDLHVTKDQIAITAGADPGLFYGAVTLWQLMTPDDRRGPVALAPVSIQDTPRFAWRGLLLDSARHYQSPAFIERLIDDMALHKLNTLHWHLTDDQAWRLEIQKYPRLTEVGGWRVPAGDVAQADIDPATGRPRREGGIYTQDQVRRIVAYAAARQITVVPEIEMPGHALSAILAYPQLGSAGPAPPAIQSDWGVFPYLYNTDDATFGFLQDVLTEVMALFPSPFIHIGGDEAAKDQWKASPRIQAQMKALGIKDEDALQGWYTHRIDAFLTAHGRRTVGWDEILQGGALPPTTTVMSWHGVDGALAAARSGHDAVLAPAPTLYFDNRQSDRASEPTGRGFTVSLKDVYAFDPAPGALTDAERKHILGLQANLWTEHVRTEDQVPTMLFPRLAAVAEAGWTPQADRRWPDFVSRLPAQFDRYRALGIAADDAAVSVRIEARPTATAGQASVTLSNETGLGEIRYTTDGTAPTAASPVYDKPLTLATPVQVQAVTVVAGQALAAPSRRAIDDESLRLRVSQDLKLCQNKLGLNLDDRTSIAGDHAKVLVDIMDPCWIYDGAQLNGAVRITASVGRAPFNFQLGAARADIPLRPPHTPDGELEVRLDGCAGQPIAVLPLAAARRLGMTTLAATLPPLSGRHDLCLSFTAKSLDPMWVINWVRLDPAGAGKVGG